MLDLFYKSIDTIVLRDVELLLKLRLLRDLLRHSLSHDSFRIGLVQAVLNTMFGAASQDIWRAPPIFINKHLKYSIRVIFWPAFYDNHPHQHNTWSITGVLYNALTVNIYRLVKQDRLKRERTIAAIAHDAGYLMPGAIHNISNRSHAISSSLHIFNHLDGTSQEKNETTWLISSRHHDLSNGIFERACISCLLILQDIKTTEAYNMINDIYEHAPWPIKWVAIKALYLFDRGHANDCLNKLAAIL
ncbi:MAG: hypothetical protein ACD_46C00237G0006 [uncultured bacterium]|nr:MAG: hypothetical protein ACD_46C00237G0006 [uncultured bacterium]